MASGTRNVSLGDGEASGTRESVWEAGKSWLVGLGRTVWEAGRLVGLGGICDYYVVTCVIT